MAEKSIHQKGNLDKMAVNSVDHRVESQAKDEYAKESIESLQSKGLQRAKSMEGHPTKKKGSFQITRVIPKSSGLNDPDQDSVDDIDETNTEDVSSDILDISKNTDIDPDPSSNDTVQSLAPEEFGLPSVKEAGKGLPQQSHSQPQVGVESSTQQYNMSVSSVLASTSQTTLHQSQASPVSVTQQQQEDGHVKINDMQSRFKLVKIESREPFKRGRWTCLDFLDPPPSDKDKGLERADRSLDEIGSGNSSASSSIHYIHGVDDPSKNPIAVNVVHAEGHTVLEPQPIHAVPPQSQLQNGDFIPQQVMSVPSVITNGGIPTQPFVTDANGGPGPEASTQPIPSMPSQTKQPLPSQQVPTSQTGHLQNIVSSTQAPNLDLDVQQYPKSAIPTQTVSSSTKDPTVVKSHPSQTQVHPTIPQAQIQQSQSSQLQIDQNLPPQDYLHPQAEFDSSQNLSKTEFNTLPANPTHTTAPQQSLNTSQTSNVDFVAQSGAAATSGPSTNTSPNNENVAGEFGTSDSLGYVPTTRAEDKKVHLSTKLDKDSVLGSMAKLAGMQQSYLSPPFLEMAVSATMQPAQAVTKDDDESGASTVAIDNKIEQAMDLVKSHLMFAVREEVEVLREQIKDLIEKNNQLEYENQILKSAATAETLAQLQQPKPPTHTQPPTSSS